MRVLKNIFLLLSLLVFGAVSEIEAQTPATEVRSISLPQAYGQKSCQVRSDCATSCVPLGTGQTPGKGIVLRDCATVRTPATTTWFVLKYLANQRRHSLLSFHAVVRESASVNFTSIVYREYV